MAIKSLILILRSQISNLKLCDPLRSSVSRWLPRITFTTEAQRAIEPAQRGSCLPRQKPSRVSALSQNQDHPDNQKQRHTAGQAHDIHYNRAVFSGRRIVVIAVKHQRIDGTADLILRSFNQTQPQIARWIIDAVKVTREFSFGS